MNRQEAADQARETLQILEEGKYRPASGQWVWIRDSLATAVAGTVSYESSRTVEVPPLPTPPTEITLANQTSLAAAYGLVAEGYDPVVLNFASAKQAGGGFQRGAQAQEESLARATGLYACIKDQPMYDYHRQRDDQLYSDFALYSPVVPVFRDDSGELLEVPYQIGIVSCPAPNAGRLPESRRPELRDVFARRINRVLGIGLAHGHDAIVLGAWGCGVFRNDPVEVASLFGRTLEHEFKNRYQRVVFAILDRTERSQTYRAFCEVFDERDADDF